MALLSKFPITRLGVLLAAGVILLAASTHLVMDGFVHKYLIKQAEDQAMDWAVYLAEHVPDLEGVASGKALSPDSKSVIERARELGRVFRFKLFDKNGRLRLISDELEKESTHALVAGSANSRAAGVLESGRPYTMVKQGTPPKRPHYYSEIYLPIVSNGRAIAVVEVYVDQTDSHKLIHDEFAVAALVLMTITGLAFGVPASAFYFRTRQKMASDAHARERDTQLQLVSDNIPFLIAYVDTDYRYRFVNKAGASWYATNMGDAVGRHISDIHNPDSAEKLHKRLRIALDGNEQKFEETITYPDGKTRDIEGIHVPDCDECGTIRGVVAIIIDVSERKRQEQELKRNQTELELLLNNIPVRIFYKDDKNRFMRVNEAAAQSVGIPADELKGADNYDLFPEMAAKYHRDDLEVINSGEAKFGIIERYTPKDCEHGWVRTDKVPFTDPDTGEKFVFVAVTDITSEKLAENVVRDSEERYRRLYNETPVMQHSVDQYGQLTNVSDFWLQKLGYEREEVIGEHWASFLTPESREVMIDALEEDAKTEGRNKKVELQILTKSGGTRDVLYSSITEDKNEDGPIASLAVLADITERKSFEKQLYQAQKMQSVGQLTSGLAHDFNNLLGVVLGNLQLIERSVDGNDRATKRIGAALRAVDKGAELTRRLLAFSRKQKLETESVNLDPLFSELNQMLRRTLGESVSLEFGAHDDLPNVRTDPSQLESAILNLAVNARDAMEGDGTLTIESKTVHLGPEDVGQGLDLKPGQYVVVAVTDTGEGIPAEAIEKVFDPFFTTKDVGAGSGLGLSMVYGFVKQSGGDVRIYSEVGRGTTIRLYLPVDRDSGETLNQPVPMFLGNSVSEGTILVVEDQADVREMAVSLLEDMGYDVVEASDGREGLSVIGENKTIDLLFTDIVMPGGMDGTDLADAAHKIRPNLPVVYTTGYAEAATLHEGRVTASTNLVTKPYRREELASKIGMALANRVVDPAAVVTPPKNSPSHLSSL